ncbi:uncharacterized protein VP01_2957g2, partial [Puccinia sorghi]
LFLAAQLYHFPTTPLLLTNSLILAPSISLYLFASISSGTQVLVALPLILCFSVSKYIGRTRQLDLLQQKPDHCSYMSEPDNTLATAAQTASEMDKINTTILKTAIEAIPLLTNDNYTLWKNRVENVLDLQDLRTALTSSTGVLSSTEDIQLRTIITSKLESSIHANVITHDNEKSAKKIWKSISEYFASSQASNRARVFNAVLHVQFNPNDVQDFITQVKTSISRLHEVGIDLPKDIIAYLILHKLPASMTNISQQITHSDKPITAELVLDHLRLPDSEKGRKGEASTTPNKA